MKSCTAGSPMTLNCQSNYWAKRYSMPRPKVYGKKSRAIGGPQVLVFSSSPESQRRSSPVQTPSEDTVQGCARVELKRTKSLQAVERSAERQVLGEKNANPIVVHGRRDDDDKCKAQTPARQRNQSDDDLQHQTMKTGAHEANSNPSQRRKAAKSSRSERTTAPEDEPAGAEIPSHAALHPASRSSSTVTNERSDSPASPVQSTPRRNVYTEHCRDLLSCSLSPETSFTTFSDWSAELAAHFHVSKIAEASFGEVYRLSLLDAIPGFTTADESVFKIIALKSPSATHPHDKRKRNALAKKETNMSKPEDVANEVRVLQRMSSIPGFTNFRDVRILQGRPTEPFITAFRSFDTAQRARGKDGTHFPDPGKTTSYASEQLWAVIEMQDAGVDLERALEEIPSASSIWAAWDIFWHATLALAKGEQGAEFEHRDLHLGNICVHNLPQTLQDAKDDLDYDIDLDRRLAFTPVQATIIDYTLSRARLVSDHPDAASPSDTDVVYNDLDLDPALFHGDSTDEYQYDIYRYMRGVLFHDDAYLPFSEESPPVDSPEEQEQRSWKGYHPQTNLVWLHFILYKMLEQVSWPSELRGVRKKNKKQYARWTRAKELEKVLLETQDLLHPEQICKNGLMSAGDLVALAINEGWLDVADVVGTNSLVEESEDEGGVLVEELQGLRIAAAPNV